MRDEERELATDAHNEVGMTMRKIRAARWNGSRRVEFNVPATRSVARHNDHGLCLSSLMSYCPSLHFASRGEAIGVSAQFAGGCCVPIAPTGLVSSVWCENLSRSITGVVRRIPVRRQR